MSNEVSLCLLLPLVVVGVVTMTKESLEALEKEIRKNS